MVTIAQLRKIRDREKKQLQTIKSKAKKVMALEREKRDMIGEIKKIRAERQKNKVQRQKMASKEIQLVKKGAKKVGKAVLDYLYAIRGD